ncbi:MAG TPA: hypothetical protein VFB38_09645 [Chthonomonadaceae bacterium]|nr:hypothetical protein [Chthonomonadaceae bacterium]
MSKRMSLGVLAILVFALCWSGVHSAVSQQAAERKSALIVGYPNPAIIIGGSGTRYGGIIYVSVYPVSPGQVPGQGAQPVATAEMTPSQRSVWQLPLGVYEVRYGMRTGSEMKTFIVRDVILRPEGASSLTIEMNADAKTTILGGDMSAQEMQEDIRSLLKEVSDLKQEVRDLKK